MICQFLDNEQKLENPETFLPQYLNYHLPFEFKSGHVKVNINLKVEKNYIIAVIFCLKSNNVKKKLLASIFGTSKRPIRKKQ